MSPQHFLYFFPVSRTGDRIIMTRPFSSRHCRHTHRSTHTALADSWQVTLTLRVIKHKQQWSAHTSLHTITDTTHIWSPRALAASPRLPLLPPAVSVPPPPPFPPPPPLPPPLFAPPPPPLPPPVPIPAVAGIVGRPVGALHAAAAAAVTPQARAEDRGIVTCARKFRQL